MGGKRARLSEKRAAKEKKKAKKLRQRSRKEEEKMWEEERRLRKESARLAKAEEEGDRKREEELIAERRRLESEIALPRDKVRELIDVVPDDEDSSWDEDSDDDWDDEESSDDVGDVRADSGDSWYDEEDEDEDLVDNGRRPFMPKWMPKELRFFAWFMLLGFSLATTMAILEDIRLWKETKAAKSSLKDSLDFVSTEYRYRALALDEDGEVAQLVARFGPKIQEAVDRKRFSYDSARDELKEEIQKMTGDRWAGVQKEGFDNAGNYYISGKEGFVVDIDGVQDVGFFGFRKGPTLMRDKYALRKAFDDYCDSNRYTLRSLRNEKGEHGYVDVYEVLKLKTEFRLEVGFPIDTEVFFAAPILPEVVVVIAFRPDGTHEAFVYEGYDGRFLIQGEEYKLGTYGKEISLKLGDFSSWDKVKLR